mgnify:CR=1 FL=1
MAQAPLNKLCLATLCSASQKAGHFPCGKSLVLPRAPRRYFRAAEIRYLARKQSARDKFILLFRLRRKFVALGKLGR